METVECLGGQKRLKSEQKEKKGYFCKLFILIYLCETIEK
jgi:hypothetical protein